MGQPSERARLTVVIVIVVVVVKLDAVEQVGHVEALVGIARGLGRCTSNGATCRERGGGGVRRK